jgi:tripeptidyl-peptidase-1
MFAPAANAVKEVRDFLLRSGVADNVIVHSENKGWLAFDIPSSKAEELFQTEYHEHFHYESGKVKVGCDE